VNNPRPRKHHYLPQFYLRGFSANGTHIYQAEKRTGKIFGGRIADTGAIRDFHTLDFDGCPDPDAFEKLIGRVEAEVAPALADILETATLRSATRPHLDSLVAMLLGRVPAVKEMVEAGLLEAVRSVGLLLEKNGKLPPKPAGLEDELAFENVAISISNWKIMDHMFRLAFDPDILSTLGRCTARLIRVPAGKSFITGDQPVSQFNGDARPEDMNGWGLADPDSVLTLPLSSALAVQLSWSGELEECVRMAAAAEVDEINRRAITMSTERLFAHAFDGSIEKLLLRYGHCTAGSKLDVIRTEGAGSYHVQRTVPVMDSRLYEPLGAKYEFVPIQQRPSALQRSQGSFYPMITQRIPMPH